MIKEVKEMTIEELQELDGDFDIHVPFKTKNGKCYKLVEITPLLPAEDAEAKKTCVLCTKPAMDNGLCYEHNMCNVPKQPTADGAEEILEPKLYEITEIHTVPYFRKMRVESGYMYNFWDILKDEYQQEWHFVPDISLHAQKIADKMVSERLSGDDTKKLLQTIISWEKNLSDYMSLETKLRELFIIKSRER